MNKRYCSVNNWLVDIASGAIIHLTTGERKRLGEYQLKLLDILVQDAGRIFSREELTHLVWERRVIGNNSLPNAIHALRTALEDDGKTQRIIKTIPRKGYLLEAEYCRMVEKDENEISTPEEEIPVEQEHVEPPAPAEPVVPLPVACDEVDTLPASVATVVREKHTLWRLLLVVLLTAGVTFSICWYFMHNTGERLVAREIQPGVYSNIHLYSIGTSGEPGYTSANLYNKLKVSLYELNQQIKMHDVSMRIYFFTKNSSLSYSFTLSSKCDEKQLAMTIYHWRTDTEQLNDLIVRETRRKLNEMATCKAG